MTTGSSELIDLQTPSRRRRKTKTYVHLMRAAHQICEEPELSRLAPRSRASPRPTATATASRPTRWRVHENIAYDWLAQGGKRSRPFITLAAYDALKGAPGTLSAEGCDLPDGVRRTALAIEAFHKASLVHDDIEDDDTFRYGRETLHRQYGVGTAINVGDYLHRPGLSARQPGAQGTGRRLHGRHPRPPGRRPPETVRGAGGRTALARRRATSR